MSTTIKKVFKDRIEYRNTEGQWHRTDGPAIIWHDGSKVWYVNGKLHRTDGPALEDTIAGLNSWFINGEYYSELDYWKEIYSMGLITKPELMIKLL
jgi:hypothetical protein